MDKRELNAQIELDRAEKNFQNLKIVLRYFVI